MMLRQKLVLLTAVLAVAVVGVFFYYHQGSLPQAVSFDVSNQPSIGSPSAPVHLVVFEDLKCFNCRKFQVKIFPEIKKKYIDTGKVRFTFVPLSFLDNSERVANALLSVYSKNPDRFFPYLERIERAFSTGKEDWDSEERLIGYAVQVGEINIVYLEACLRMERYLPELRDNFSLAKSVMGDQVATPSLYINGIPTPTMKWNIITHRIEKLLKEASHAAH
jgi:protein-disulfide isomerase